MLRTLKKWVNRLIEARKARVATRAILSVLSSNMTHSIAKYGRGDKLHICVLTKHRIPIMQKTVVVASIKSRAKYMGLKPTDWTLRIYGEKEFKRKGLYKFITRTGVFLYTSK